MCMRGHRVLFTTAAALLMNSSPPRKRGRWKGTTATRPLGPATHRRTRIRYRSNERRDLLFQLISQRYERRSIALTTNLPFEKWTQIFPDEMVATAVIDRLVHHGAVFAFTGQSHRLRTRGKSSKDA